MEWQTSSVLLQRLADSREQEGWTLLVEHFRPPVLRLARRMGLGNEDAEDAAQNALTAFATAFRSGRYDREKGRLRQWLYGFASRQISNTLRTRGRAVHDLQAAGLSGSFLVAIPAPEAGLEACWEEEWRRSIYERSLVQVQVEVEPQTFEIFRLLVLQEIGADEVATRLGVTRTQVYNAKYRVAKRLGELAREYEDA